MKKILKARKELNKRKIMSRWQKPRKKPDNHQEKLLKAKKVKAMSENVMTNNRVIELRDKL